MLKQKQFHYKIIVKMSFFIAILFWNDTFTKAKVYNNIRHGKELCRLNLPFCLKLVCITFRRDHFPYTCRHPSPLRNFVYTLLDMAESCRQAFGKRKTKEGYVI